MPRSLIIGGTKGLGLCLAQESLSRGIQPIILGRSTDGLRNSLLNDDPLREAIFSKCDITDSEPLRWNAVADGLAASPGTPVVVWNSGIFLRKPITEVTPDDIAKMTAVHFTGPVNALARLHARFYELGRPYHLITVASTSAWRSRLDENVYCALKAAKSQFTRCMAKEMTRDLPGSKATLVQPGGMATPNFWGGTGTDISKFMDPAVVAKIIWSRATTQLTPFEEYSLLRMDDGTPRVKEGPQLPE